MSDRCKRCKSRPSACFCEAGSRCLNPNTNGAGDLGIRHCEGILGHDGDHGDGIGWWPRRRPIVAHHSQVRGNNAHFFGVEGPPLSDNINHPDHYKWLPVEAIDITENFNFNMGNALKYIIRADHKGKPVEDLKKARWYIDREIERREKGE